MPSAGTCKACQHPESHQINTELLNRGHYSRSINGTARFYRLAEETLRRHAHNCLGIPTRKTEPEPEPEPAPTPQAGIPNDLLDRALKLQDKAFKSGPQFALPLIRELIDIFVESMQRVESDSQRADSQDEPIPPA